jgi:hypothetical protein
VSLIHPVPSFCEARRVGTLDSSAAMMHSSSARLVMSGSRGIGGVIATPQGVTTFDLYDLEEDEVADSQSDSQSMDA